LYCGFCIENKVKKIKEMVKNKFFTKFHNRFEIYTKSYLNTKIFKKIDQEFIKLGLFAGSTLRLGTQRKVRNGERPETFMMYMMNGLKRLQNHVHVHGKTKEPLY
jgi:hypothetical protein